MALFKEIDEDGNQKIRPNELMSYLKSTHLDAPVNTTWLCLYSRGLFNCSGDELTYSQYVTKNVWKEYCKIKDCQDIEELEDIQKLKQAEPIEKDDFV